MKCFDINNVLITARSTKSLEITRNHTNYTENIKIYEIHKHSPKLPKLLCSVLPERFMPLDSHVLPDGGKNYHKFVSLREL